MRLAVVCIALSVVLVACSTQPRVIDRSTGTVYSEYFENDSTVLDGALRLHTIITMGDERVPEDHVWPEVARKRLQRNGDVFPIVLEVYATNLSSEPIEISFVSIEPKNKNRKFPTNGATIEPGEFTKSPPLIHTTSIYIPQVFDHFLEVNVDGERVVIEGEVQRLTVEELEARAGKAAR
ncbi:MAG: hypothetical protein AAGJ86_11680 [Pseudomonadota bacterium]